MGQTRLEALRDGIDASKRVPVRVINAIHNRILGTRVSVPNSKRQLALNDTCTLHCRIH